MAVATARQPAPVPRRLGGGAWLLGGVLLVACLPVAAQVAAVDDYLMRMDRDGDRRVSLPEYQDWLSYAFDAMDRDRDGVLTAAELPGGRGNAVTRAQHRARLAAAFARQDRDRNGWLDAGELSAPPH